MSNLQKHIDEKLTYLRGLKARNDATEYALTRLEVYEEIALLAVEEAPAGELGHAVNCGCNECYTKEYLAKRADKRRAETPGADAIQPQIESDEWEQRFDRQFFQDITGERVEGYLAMYSGPGFCKIAIPQDIKRFIRAELETQSQRERKLYEKAHAELLKRAAAQPLPESAGVSIDASDILEALRVADCTLHANIKHLAAPALMAAAINKRLGELAAVRAEEEK